MNAKRKDLIMSATMGVLVVFSMFYFVLRPQQAKLASVRTERSNLEQALTAAQAQLVTPASAVPLDSSAAPVVDEVPAEPELADLLRQLQIIGQDTGVVQQSVSPSALSTNPSGPGGSLQITIGASGPHAAVADYLQRIRDLERLVVIEQVGIESTDADDSVQLVLRVFTQQAPIDEAVNAP